MALAKLILWCLVFGEVVSRRCSWIPRDLHPIKWLIPGADLSSLWWFAVTHEIGSNVKICIIFAILTLQDMKCTIALATTNALGYT